MEPTLRTLSPSWRRHLLAANPSAPTVKTYLGDSSFGASSFG